MTANFEQTSTTLTKVSGDTRLLVSDGGKLRQLIDALNQVIIEDQKFVKIVAQIEETATLSKTICCSLRNRQNRLMNGFVNSEISLMGYRYSFRS